MHRLRILYTIAFRFLVDLRGPPSVCSSGCTSTTTLPSSQCWRTLGTEAVKAVLLGLENYPRTAR